MSMNADWYDISIALNWLRNLKIKKCLLLAVIPGTEFETMEFVGKGLDVIDLEILEKERDDFAQINLKTAEQIVIISMTDHSKEYLVEKIKNLNINW